MDKKNEIKDENLDNVTGGNDLINTYNTGDVCGADIGGISGNNGSAGSGGGVYSGGGGGISGGGNGGAGNGGGAGGAVDIGGVCGRNDADNDGKNGRPGC